MCIGINSEYSREESIIKHADGARQTMSWLDDRYFVNYNWTTQLYIRSSPKPYDNFISIQILDNNSLFYFN